MMIAGMGIGALRGVVPIGDDDKVLVFDLFDWFFLDFSVLLFLQLIFLWVVCWRYLNYGVDNHIEVRLLFSGFFDQFLVDTI